MEEIALLLDEAEEMMGRAVARAGQELAKIRAGRAMPNMLDGIMAAYYGSQTPINQLATISTPDARSLLIKPWEKSVLPEIERAIINSDLGLNPQNDGEMIRIVVPPLTEERRRDLVKQAKAEAENAKVSMRNIRKDTNDSLKSLLKAGASEDLVKDAQGDVQKLTDTHTAHIDKLLAAREADIMTI